MHEVQPRLFVEHMAVKGGYLDAVLTQRLDDGVHFIGDQNEIARYRGLAGAGRLEVDPGG